MAMNTRTKFYVYNTMACLLKALEEKYITVEIRSDVIIRGKLDILETTMSLNMSDVVLTDAKGRATHFSKFYVKGRQIRYVIIPDEIDIVKAMNWQLNKDDYFKEKERRYRNRLFQKRQDARAKKAAKLSKHGHS